MKDIKIIDGGSDGPSWYSKDDIVVMKSGKEIAVSSYAGIVLQGETPVSVFYSRILHKPVKLFYFQNNVPREVVSFYISQSYRFDFIMLALLLLMIVYMKRIYKFRTNADLSFYIFLILFVFIITVQYCTE